MLIIVAGCAVSSGAARRPSLPNSVAAAPAAAQIGADYARIEAEVLGELNSARADPAAYSAHLAELLPQFHGNLLDRPGWPAAIRTLEGPAAVREAIAALQAQARVAPVVGSAALSAAARDLAAAQVSGGVGHTGANGSTPGSRISAHGTWGSSYNENVAYGQFLSGRDVVVDLLVDDGVPDRGHRRNIFDSRVHVAGVACGPHATYKMVCVIDQAGSFTAR
jgi:hypothetical protein